MPTCKQCHIPIIADDCNHPDCKRAYIRGFCCAGCEQVYEWGMPYAQAK